MKTKTIEATPIARLENAIEEKRKLQKNLKDAINSHVTINLEYLHKGNDIRLHPAEIQEKLELKKAPTEKQTGAYIEETYHELKDELDISKENVSLIKKEIDLIDDEISLYKYQIQLELKNE